jgi:hypothetical protein
LLSIGTNLRSWEACQTALRTFLKTTENYLLLHDKETDIAGLPYLSDSNMPPVDLIQFCKLRVYEKGELGIREGRFLFLKFISELMKSKFLIWLIAPLAIKFAGKIYTRLAFIKKRQGSISHALMGISGLRDAIPHYIEPRESTLIMSRKFAIAILDLGRSVEVSLFRISFALARSSNFACVRVRRIFQE